MKKRCPCPHALRWLRRCSAVWQANSGAALVETAVILPVFLTLVGGIYEFGFFLYQEQLVTSGVRDAAHYLALTTDPTSITSQAYARNIAVYGSIDPATPRVRGWDPSDLSISVAAIDNSAGTYGGTAVLRIVTVSTRLTEQSLGFLGLLGLNAPAISAVHQERWIGGSARRQG